MRALLLLAVSALLCGSGRADVAGAPAVRVLVLDVTSATVDPAVLGPLSSLLSSELARLDGLEVLSAQDVKKLVELEAQKQVVGCEDASCLAELAGALGARYVVVGDAGQIGALTLLNVSLFDAARGRPIARAAVKGGSLEDVARQVPALVRELAGQAGLGAQGTPGRAAHAAWLWGFVGAGAAVAAGGALYDVMAPSSGDARLDGWDAIGPGAVVLGGCGVLLGLFLNPFDGGPPDA